MNFYDTTVNHFYYILDRTGSMQRLIALNAFQLIGRRRRLPRPVGAAPRLNSGRAWAMPGLQLSIFWGSMTVGIMDLFYMLVVGI